jgi:CheY-like chemotaxis protein
MALALENSRLYEEAQRTLADLQTAQEELVRGATLRALGELASGAAHHLNNLLAVITGRVQLLLQTAEGPAIRQPLEMVNQAAADAAEVVRRVQRFARTQALEDRQPVDLNQVAREVVEMTRARWHEEAQAHGISIDVALELNHVSFVLGNSAALREVATNLLINAVDAMPYGGRIILRTFDDDADVCLVVSDEGVGMPPAVRERALEPFFTTKGIRSTGLGLSVNYGIVRGHGGEMRIDSVEGRGTTIIIRLPRQTSQPAAAATVSDSEGEPSTAVSRLRILVIDDDEPVRGLMADILMAQGNEVAEAASGADGLRLLEAESSIDLVLTDLGMPKMSGWEVARAIKSRWPWIPVGVVTGWGEEPLGITQHGHLVTGILTKPVTVDSMQAFVATAMRGADAAAETRPLDDR